MSQPDSIARNTSFALAVRLLSAAFTAGLTIFLVRYLGPEDYGEFALALGIGVLVLIPSNMGVSQAAARFIAERRGDPTAVAEVVADALVLKLVIGAVFSLALALVAGLIADAYGVPDLEWPLRIMALAVFFQGLLLFYDSAFESLGRLSAYLRVVGAEAAVETGASIAFVLLGGGVAGAVWGRAAGYGLAAGMGLVVLARTVGSRAPMALRRGHGHRRKIFSYGSALVLVEGAFTAFAKIDVLLIGAILSVSAVGLFEAPMRVVAFLGFVGAAVAAGVAPRVTLSGEGARPEALVAALRGLILLQGVLIAPLLVWASPIADIVLGPDYAESAEVLRAIVPYAVLIGISPLVAHAVNYLGEGRRRVPIAIGALLLNLVIDAALLSEIGIVAGAIGTDIAYTLYVGAHFWIIRRLLDLRLRSLLPAVAQTLAAAGAMAGVLLAFGTGADLATPAVIAGTILSLAAYAGVLVLTGAVSRTELSGLLRRFRAARAR